MFVDGGEGELPRGGRRPEPVEAVLEDGVDVTVGASLDSAGAGTSSLQPVRAVALSQPQDAEARAIALLGMGPIRENRLHQRGGLRADGAAPVDEARGGPLEVALMRLRHVGGIGRVVASDEAPPMGGEALAAVKDLDGGRAQAGVDMLVDERVGDGVVVAVEFDDSRC